MDPNSNMMATQMVVHKQDFAEMTKFIDERYRVTYGHVEFHSLKDDPMGIFATGTRDPDPAEPIPTEDAQMQQQGYNDQAHLDAFGKGGKSKGKGYNDGKCHVRWRRPFRARLPFGSRIRWQGFRH